MAAFGMAAPAAAVIVLAYRVISRASASETCAGIPAVSLFAADSKRLVSACRRILFLKMCLRISHFYPFIFK
jgi:hypothetical protein